MLPKSKFASDKIVDHIRLSMNSCRLILDDHRTLTTKLNSLKSTPIYRTSIPARLAPISPDKEHLYSFQE
jgi:hypothetical protein